MFEELKKNTFKKSLALSVIMILAGVCLSGFNIFNMIYVIAGYDTFSELAPDEIKANQLVDIDVSLSVGCFLEKYEQNTETGRKRTTDLYYVIFTGDEEDEDFRYMAIKIPPKYEDDMEKISNNTFNGYLSEPISFSGQIQKMSETENRYFRKYFSESDWSEAEIDEWTLPYCINVMDKSGKNTLTIILFTAGLLLVCFGIVRIVIGSKGGFLKKLGQDIKKAGYDNMDAASDYEHALYCGDSRNILLGRILLFYDAGRLKPRALPASKLVWAYQTITTHRTNGIKTGTSYSIIFYTEDSKKAYTTEVSCDASAQEIIRKISVLYPWTVTGYSDELKSLYQRDRNQFLQLCYTKCEHVVTVDSAWDAFAGFTKNQG